LNLSTIVWINDRVSCGKETFDRQKVEVKLRATWVGDKVEDPELERDLVMYFGVDDSGPANGTYLGGFDPEIHPGPRIHAADGAAVGLDHEYDELRAGDWRAIPKKWIEQYLYDTVLFDASPSSYAGLSEEDRKRLQREVLPRVRYVNSILNQYDRCDDIVPMDVELDHEWPWMVYTFPIDTTQLHPGPWDFEVEVDYRDIVSEYSEANNLAAGSFVIDRLASGWYDVLQIPRESRPTAAELASHDVGDDTIPGKEVTVSRIRERSFCCHDPWTNDWDQEGVYKTEQNVSFVAERMAAPGWTSKQAKDDYEHVFAFFPAQQAGDISSATSGADGDWKWSNQYDMRETREIRPRSIAGQVIAQGTGEYGDFGWPYDPDNTLLVNFFDHENDLLDAEWRKRRNVKAIHRYLIERTNDLRSTKLVYLAGASRGGVVALRLAKRLLAFKRDHGLSDLKIFVSAIDPHGDRNGAGAELGMDGTHYRGGCGGRMYYTDLDEYLGSPSVDEMEVFVTAHNGTQTLWGGGSICSGESLGRRDSCRADFGVLGEGDAVSIDPGTAEWGYYYQNYQDYDHSPMVRYWQCEVEGAHLRWFFQRAGWGSFTEVGVEDPCPAWPGSCSGSCGGQVNGDGCWCDEACRDYGDCCADVEAYCPLP